MIRGGPCQHMHISIMQLTEHIGITEGNHYRGFLQTAQFSYKLPLIRIQLNLLSRSHIDKGADHQQVGLSGTAKDRKSTRLNSSHVATSYAVFGLKKKSTSTAHRRSRALQPTGTGGRGQ